MVDLKNIESPMIYLICPFDFNSNLIYCYLGGKVKLLLPSYFLMIDFWCFNATFNNISAISWRPVLVVEEAGVPGENH